MKPPLFEYRAPHTSEETLALLAKYGDEGRVLAGGQSLVPLLNFRMARPACLIDLNRCSEFDYLRLEEESVVIGAMTRQADAENSRLVHEHCPLLAEALTFMGHPTIRNRGTVGGSLAHADPGGELPAVAMALGAEIVLERTGGKRSLTPEKFFIDSLVTAIETGEVLREARFPARRTGDRHAFVESGVRRADLAIAGVAAQIRVAPSGICDKISFVALGGGTRPTRLSSVETAVEGRNIADIDIGDVAGACREDVDPPSDLQATGEYRRELLVSLTRRALKKLFDDEAKT
jgi:aerobic carbon-monoxide dehydrogenase medium subunit